MWLYGVSSKIPPFFISHHNLGNRNHWLLIDIDDKNPSVIFELDKFCLKKFGRKLDWFDFSPNGIHAIVFKAFLFEELVNLMPLIPHMDLNFFKIGLERGYWFMVLYNCFFRRDVSFMKIRVADNRCGLWLNTKLRQS